MSVILRATQRNAGVQAVAFNFEDMAAQASRYLETVRQEAAKLVAQARHQAEQQAERIRARAEAEGYQAGEAAVAEMVRKQLAEQLATLMPAMQQVVTEIRNAKQAWLAHWEKSAVHVSAAIARRLIRRELSHSPEIAVALLREALELAAGSPQVRIHLNPADHQALQPQVEAILKELSLLGQAELIADPEITPGGCRLETRFGVIDQQLETQLARIEEELT
ncbi:MAG: FliH/SctL family protein [Thermoguttaceae bacterium]